MAFLSQWINQYPWLSIILGVLQIAFIVHVVVTRRQWFWIFVLLFLPGLGVVLYLFIEVLPGMRRGRGINLQPALEAIKSPETRIRERREALAETDTLANRVSLAQALRQAGRLDEAEATLEPLRVGIYNDDPALLTELADLAMRRGDPARARELLGGIDLKRSAAVRTRTLTLLAEAAEALNEPQVAEGRYREAMTGATTEEPRAKFAHFLYKQGRQDEAKAVLADLERTWKRGTNLYRRQEREWFAHAQELRKQLG